MITFNFFKSLVYRSYRSFIFNRKKVYVDDRKSKRDNYSIFLFLSNFFSFFSNYSFLRLSKFELIGFSILVTTVSNNNFYSIKWSSLILNFLSSFYRLYKIPGGSPKRLPDYYDTLIFLMSIYTDRSFSFNSHSLSSSHCSLQLYKINNKRMQNRWFRVNSSFNRYFINISKFSILSSYFVDKIKRSSFEVIGRASNYPWCISSRIRTWGNVINRIQPFGHLHELYSMSKDFSITRWGVASVCISYCTSDFGDISSIY